jgi:8-amino-7-oxononanoate synthase
MLPPATPGGASFLRCSISAAHTPEQIATIIKNFAALK